MRFAALALVLLPSLASAQGRPAVEIGTGLGVTIVDAGGSVTHIGIPGMGLLGQPTIYAGFYAGKKVLIEPSIALNRLSGGGDALTTLGFGGQLGYHTRGTGANSLFLAANMAVESVHGGGESDSEFGLGGKIGYRVLIKSSAAVRFEAGYRRWFSGDANEITFGMTFGGIIH